MFGNVLLILFEPLMEVLALFLVKVAPDVALEAWVPWWSCCMTLAVAVVLLQLVHESFVVDEAGCLLVSPRGRKDCAFISRRGAFGGLAVDRCRKMSGCGVWVLLVCRCLR